MMTGVTAESEAREFARQWVAAWNSHDLDAITSHYDAAVVLTSPVAAKILNNPSETVEGNAALRNYFERGLELYPNLHFCVVGSVQHRGLLQESERHADGRVHGERENYPSGGKLQRVTAATESCHFERRRAFRHREKSRSESGSNARFLFACGSSE
jgi:hypothetical protein